VRSLSCCCNANTSLSMKQPHVVSILLLLAATLGSNFNTLTLSLRGDEKCKKKRAYPLLGESAPVSWGLGPGAHTSVPIDTRSLGVADWPADQIPHPPSRGPPYPHQHHVNGTAPPAGKAMNEGNVLRNAEACALGWVLVSSLLTERGRNASNFAHTHCALRISSGQLGAGA
jgi:hypothetical protein